MSNQETDANGIAQDSLIVGGKGSRAGSRASALPAFADKSRGRTCAPDHVGRELARDLPCMSPYKVALVFWTVFFGCIVAPNRRCARYSCRLPCLIGKADHV